MKRKQIETHQPSYQNLECRAYYYLRLVVQYHAVAPSSSLARVRDYKLYRKESKLWILQYISEKTHRKGNRFLLTLSSFNTSLAHSEFKRALSIVLSHRYSTRTYSKLLLRAGHSRAPIPTYFLCIWAMTRLLLSVSGRFLPWASIEVSIVHHLLQSSPLPLHTQ